MINSLKKPLTVSAIVSFAAHLILGWTHIQDMQYLITPQRWVLFYDLIILGQFLLTWIVICFALILLFRVQRSWPSIAIGLFLGLFVSTVFWSVLGSIRYRSSVNKVLKTGYILELPKKPSSNLAEEDNAAYWFRKAAAESWASYGQMIPITIERNNKEIFQKIHLHDVLNIAVKDLIKGQKRHPSVLAAAKTILLSHKQALDFARRGQACKSTQWRYQFERPLINLDSPNFGMLSDLVLFEAGTTSGVERVKNLNLFISLLEARRQIPLVMDVVAASTDGSRFLRLLRKQGIPKEWQKSPALISNSINEDLFLSSYKKHMRQELFHPYFFEQDIPALAALKDSWLPSDILLRPFVKWELSPTLGWGQTLAAGLDMPYGQVVELSSEVMKMVEVSSSRLGPTIFSGNMLPYTYRNVLHWVMDLKILLTVLKAKGNEAFIRKNLPKDLFDGGQLHTIKKEGKTYLYSIGPDLKDDSGASYEHLTRKGDIVWPVIQKRLSQ